MKRVILIVMDSVGVGELPDAEKYGDRGSNTLGNIAAALQDFSLDNLGKLGLGYIEGMESFIVKDRSIGSYGRMAEKSAGKDTTTGHWEMAGIILDKPFPVYPDGFPQSVIKEFEQAIGTRVIGNYTASGTEIIKVLGQQHVRTGYPIVYTSADSVFQIAAHEEVIPIERLYGICRIAREILQGEHSVGRVIARPFTGIEGAFVRTDRRHDFSLEPVRATILDALKEKGMKVKGVGKIKDIFNGRGITDFVYIHGNMDGVDKTLDLIKEDFTGIILANLVDFDMLYGHRNNVQGYAAALKEFDSRIPEILNSLKDEDILMITADHGCDPTTGSTDHSREYVPLLVYGKKLKKGINLGTRTSFVDIAETIAEIFAVDTQYSGESFYGDVML
ncbi:MAG: phosphopentomutase [Ruminiclostridium sp.]|nr:phosphopentomutase [Ruminiclostridium sp.]